MNHRRIWLRTAAIFLVSVAVGTVILAQAIRLEVTSRRQNALKNIDFYSRRLHDAVTLSTSGAFALAAMLQETQGEVRHFDSLAPEISRAAGGVNSVRIDPDGIVRYAWPERAKYRSLGLDVLTDPQLSKLARVSRSLNRPILGGPVNLGHGGPEMFALVPVFLEDSLGRKEFWGFAEVDILVSDLIRQSGIDRAPASGWDYEIQRYGEEVTSSGRGPLNDPVTETISMSNAMWNVSMEPRDGWYSADSEYIGFGLILILSIGVSAAARVLLMRPAALEQVVASRTSELQDTNNRLAQQISERNSAQQELWAANARLAQEIAEKNLAQQELLEREARFRRVIELAPIGIAIVAPDGRFLSVNRSLLEMLGYSEEELLSKRFQDITVLEVLQNEIVGVSEMQKILEGSQEVFEIDKRYICKDGHLVNVAITVAGVRDDQGRLLHTISLIQNVTEKLGMEARLRLSHKMQAIGTLAGGIAHDFNNVLAVVRGNAQILASGLATQEEIEKCALSIDRTSARAQDLVGQILTFSRGEDVPESAQPLVPMVTDAVQLIRSTLPVSLHIETDISEEDLFVRATATDVHRVLMNLGSNAAGALDGKAGTLKIAVRRLNGPIPGMGELSDAAEISVSDSGPGIDHSVVDRIFEPFFTTKEKGYGTGLGLSIVHGIVSSLGGIVLVESELGVGTTFRVLIPVVEATEPAKVLSGPEKPRRGEGKVVMFIDDDEDLVFLAERVLGRLGYTVDGETNPDLAVKRFSADPCSFDLVCCDLTMPASSGMEVAARLRSIRSDVPVLLMSGFVRPEDQERATALGLAKVITKPDMMVSLPLLVQKALSGS